MQCTSNGIYTLYLYIAKRILHGKLLSACFLLELSMQLSTWAVLVDIQSLDCKEVGLCLGSHMAGTG